MSVWLIHRMNIKGLYKTSLIDFPGRISSVIFTGGCNMKCGYCHNPDLAKNSSSLEVIPEKEILSFLKKRKGILDGVTITGGEPTLNKGLIPFLKKIKSLGLDIKLDSNALKPEVINEAIQQNLVDYVAIDIKTSPEKYNDLTKTEVNFSKITETIEILNNNNIDYEVRTTCIPEFVTLEDFKSIKNSIPKVKNYFLQQFVSTVDLLDKEMQGVETYYARELEVFKDFVSSFTEKCEIRGI